MTRTIRVAAVRAVLNRAPRGALGSRDVEPITRLDQQPEDGRADCERTHVEHRGHAIADEADLAGGELGDELKDELEVFQWVDSRSRDWRFLLATCRSAPGRLI